jgi:hypothetical protein
MSRTNFQSHHGHGRGDEDGDGDHGVALLRLAHFNMHVGGSHGLGIHTDSPTAHAASRTRAITPRQAGPWSSHLPDLDAVWK